jgi:hypothetical protein
MLWKARSERGAFSMAHVLAIWEAGRFNLAL